MASVTREEMLEYLRRYQAVEEWEQAELRRMPVEVRWKKMNSILRLAHSLGTVPSESISEITEAHQNWAKLKEQM